MKRLLLGWLLLLLGIGCLTQSQAFWQSRDSNYNNSSGYRGPGNIVSGAFAAWPLRAYNSAARGNKVINVCNVSDVACADLSSDPTTGQLVISAIGGSSCSVITCTIKTWYDQSGATNCGGSACDMSQATIASRPTLVVSCINSLPCAAFSGTQFMATAANIGAFSATATFSSVSIRTASFTSNQDIISIASTVGVGLNLNYRSVGNTLQMYAGTAAATVGNITDNNFHVLQAVYNDTSSVLFCGGTTGTNCSSGGTSNSISPGNVGSGSSAIFCMGMQSATAACSGNGLSGEITEILIYTSAFSGTNQTNMNSNQYNFWGPF